MNRHKKNRTKTKKEQQKQKTSRIDKIMMDIIIFGIPITIILSTSLNAALQGESFQDAVGRFAFVSFVWICVGTFLFLAFTGRLKGKPKKQGQQKSKQKRKPK